MVGERCGVGMIIVLIGKIHDEIGLVKKTSNLGGCLESRLLINECYFLLLQTLLVSRDIGHFIKDSAWLLPKSGQVSMVEFCIP
jgi:hypothetical protein